MYLLQPFLCGAVITYDPMLILSSSVSRLNVVSDTSENIIPRNAAVQVVMDFIIK